MAKAHRGKFKCRNPKKYRGDVNSITYRSSWELKFFLKCDVNPNILAWASEEVFMVIPYVSDYDGTRHRYFPDVWVRIRDKRGVISEKLIEIKPYKETIEPSRVGKTKLRYLSEAKTYIINQSKWKAAERFCHKRNWEFVKLTERDLGV